jgi:valyl-tRNA synthetase
VRGAAAFVLGRVLRLLHPVIPFVTEELWDYFGYGPEYSLIRAPWPERVPVRDAEAARAELDWVVRLVSEVRTVRAEMNVPPGTATPILLKDAAHATLERAARWTDQIRRLARASELRALAGEVPAGSAQAVVDEATVVLPLAGAIDVAVERARLLRERERAAAEVEKLARKLANADFVARAPEEVVEENRERLEAARAEVARLDAAIKRIG